MILTHFKPLNYLKTSIPFFPSPHFDPERIQGLLLTFQLTHGGGGVWTLLLTNVTWIAKDSAEFSCKNY